MRRQRGAVLIIVLWTAVLLTVLATAMAAGVRLAAATARHNQEASAGWGALMGAVSRAEMELMMELMPLPVDPEGRPLAGEGPAREPSWRFNGRPLRLAYPQEEDVVVRIYDHGGKINLNRIPRRNMQLLLEHRLGGPDADPRRVQDLLAAWTDWTDLNDLEGINGAEADHYRSLGYLPRNSPELDTVEEILHIRGFAELFEGVNLDAAFTVYGNARTVNLNLATREAMALLPGLDEELIERIVAFREREDIGGRVQAARVVPFENMQLLSPWIGSGAAGVYSVFVYRRQDPPETVPARMRGERDLVDADPVTHAHMEIMEVRAYNALPRVYRVDPYGRLPDTAPARVELPEALFAD